jgi:hypothetical protein
MPVNRIDDFVFDLFCSYEFLVIDGNEIIYRDYVDISVAVAAPKVINKMKEIIRKQDDLFNRVWLYRCFEMLRR